MTPLNPIGKFEMNRMIHARAQELALPGSPAGKNGHQMLSLSAKSAYGLKSFSELDAGQMQAMYEFMEKNKRLPGRGELAR